MTTPQNNDLSELAFVARLVHDLIAPVSGLVAVMGCCPWLDDQQTERDLASSNLALLRSMLEQARYYVQAQHLDLCCSLLPLLPLCQIAIGTVAPRAQQLGIRIVLEVEAEEPNVWGEETAIVRVLDNLLSNALGVTPAGGTITVQVIAPDPRVVEIAVIDQGPGIPPERQATLFRPGIAPPTSLGPSTTGTGMGLGLVIVAELVSLLDGGYGVQSEVGQGSRFFVQLMAVAPLRTNPEAVARVFDELFERELRAGLTERERGGVA
jgi:signal transduction histidine kinase